MIKIMNYQRKNLIIFIAAFILATIIIYGYYFNWGKKNINIKTGVSVLSWDANTEPDLVGYRVYYGTSPRTGDCPPAGYPEKLDVKKTNTPEKPTYKIKNLETGKTYYFSITSYDTSNNESCFSGEVSKTIIK